MNGLKGAVILVVDDERYITCTVCARLQKEGATVFTANNGCDGYALACSGHPSLIISDYQMPEMSGLEMCQRLKATPKTSQIPVMMLTAKGLRIRHEELHQTNIKSLMGKPFSLRELVAQVELLVSDSTERAARS